MKREDIDKFDSKEHGKVASGRYTCTGTGGTLTNTTLIDWRQLK